MIPLLVSLLLSVPTTFYPEGNRDRVVAGSTAHFLRQGMSEEQVEGILGPTLYPVHMNSLGGYAVYPAYRLRLDFSYTGGGLLSAHFTRYERISAREGRFRYLETLPLPGLPPK
jgi:hypothetical protein